MSTFFGLKLIDLAMIVAYFAAVMFIGFWASRRVKSEEDYFLGGRRFGKGLLVMHWLCTGTHSDHAVQVAGATARVGLGGIWYQWMWLFATPFYWLIAPITRRLRVITTGDVFRIRYGRSLEVLYSIVGLSFYVLSIAMLLRGAGAAISGATGGQVPVNGSVILLSVLFSTYVLAGGLVAAAYTDFLQGVMIIVLSILLVPAGLSQIGGMSALHQKLEPAMLSITAPVGAKEGDPWFVIAMSILSLVGIVAQPHVMSATGSGKTEMEARVGMCYGNFIKRFLTIAWAFTGIIAVLLFVNVPGGVDLKGADGQHNSETLFGRSIQYLLGDGWRGLMIACLIAGVTSAETFMVVGSSIFIRNFYEPAVRGRQESHYLWVGRAAAAGLLGTGILLAVGAPSVTQLLTVALNIVGLLGPAFWLGVTWRRANAAGVWASFLGGLVVWVITSLEPKMVEGVPLLNSLMQTTIIQNLHAIYRPIQILITLGVEFGLLILVSLLTKPHADEQLNAFFARLHTPVGKESEVGLKAVKDDLHEAATLGMDGARLDYQKAAAFAYRGLRRWGIELPRMNWVDWGGFLGAWSLVGALIVLLTWLARIGR
jgi:Na+/proline symporter